MPSELAFEVFGIALEATRGDDVTPPTHLLNATGTITPLHDMIDIQDQVGHLSEAEREEIAHVSSEWEVEGAADVTKLPLLANMVLEDQTAGILAGGEVTGFTVTNGGSSYETVPTVTIGAPAAGGRQAVAHAVLTADAVTSIVIDDPGNGYTSAPAVGFTGGGGSGAAATAAVSATATLTYLWEFVRTMTSDDIESATLYWGDPNNVIYKTVYAMAQELSLSSDASGTDGAQMTLSGIGQGVTELTGGSIPAPLPTVSLGPLLPGGAMQVWMNATTSPFGTTAITGRVVSAEWTCPTGVVPKYVAVGPAGGLTFDHVGRQKARPEATIQLELADTTQTALFIAGTSVRLRVRMNGRTAIEGSLYPYVQFDIEGKLRDLSWGDLESTNRTVEFTIMGVYSDQIDSDARLIIQNSSASL